MENEGEVYFKLYGNDFDPAELTRLIGIEPTSTRRKGDPQPRHATWRLSSGQVQGEVVDVYEMSTALVAKLEPAAKQILDVKRLFSLEAVLQVVLRIAIDDTLSTPAIGFTREVIAFVYPVEGSIDVDTYRNVA